MGKRDFLKEIDWTKAGDLVRKYRHGKYESRALFLRTLRRTPEIPAADLVPIVGRSISTINRYFQILQEQGLDGFFPVYSRHGKMTFAERQQLESEIRRGRFTSYGDIVLWIEQTFGITYSVPGLRALLGRRFPVDRRLLDCGTTVPSPTPAWLPPQTDRLTSFLNRLPLSLDWVTWCTQFRSALLDLFPEITYGVITLDRSSNLDGLPRTNVALSHIEMHQEDRDGEKRSSGTMNYQHEDFLARLSLQLESNGHKLEEYFPPVYFVAWVGESDLVGRIVLYFRLAEQDPRPAIEAWLEVHRPFLTFILSDGVARTAMATPQHYGMRIGVDRLIARYDLSQREGEILLLHLTGSAAEEIADSRNISPTTVRNHISNIHRKTGTRHQRELFRLVYTIGPASSIDPPADR